MMLDDFFTFYDAKLLKSIDIRNIFFIMYVNTFLINVNTYICRFPMQYLPPLVRFINMRFLEAVALILLILAGLCLHALTRWWSRHR